LGIVGLGKMGGHLAMQAAEKGMHVVAHSKHSHPDMEAKGILTEANYVTFAAALKKPRIIYLSVPAGHTVDEVLDGLVPCLAKGDVVMDGGNSFYLDSVDREKTLAKDGIYFLDCGTSGGGRRP
jgi:6-phosphogluconate dehydrogenase